MARRVLIATPTTLLALLHSVGYGWQQERVAESAQAISELGRELHGRLAKLSTLIATLGTRLNSTVKAFNEAVGSYEARVLPGARRFAEHGAVSSGAQLAEVEQITQSARDVRLAPDDERAVAEVEAADRPRPLFAVGEYRQRRRDLGAGRLATGGPEPALQILALMRQRVGGVLARLHLHECRFGSVPSRRATTPAATAAERCQPARQWR